MTSAGQRALRRGRGQQMVERGEKKNRFRFRNTDCCFTHAHEKKKLRKLLRPEKRLKAPALLILVPHIHVPQCTKRTGTQTIGWNFLFLFYFFYFWVLWFPVPIQMLLNDSSRLKKENATSYSFFPFETSPPTLILFPFCHTPLPLPISLPYFKH